jgi:molybdopterin converting factor subunit 1
VTYRVLYFASLRDQTGTDAQVIESTARDAQSLYAELQKQHGFRLPQARLRVAVNGDFAAWDCVLNEGDEIVFMPPVSGG